MPTPPSLARLPAVPPLSRLSSRLRAQVKRGDATAARRTLEEIRQHHTMPYLRDVSYRAIGWAVETAHLACLALLLEPAWGAPANASRSHLCPSLGHLLIHASRQWPPGDARWGRVDAVVGLLVDAGYQPDNPRWTPHPLCDAAQDDNLVVARALLDHGADPNGLYRWSDNKGSSYHACTPMERARTLEMIDLLLSRGARAGACGASSYCGSLAILADFPVFAGTLHRVIECWLAHGGKWDEPMETSRERVFLSLPEYAFCRSRFLAASPSGVPDTVEYHAQRRANLFALQLAIVQAGFDLDSVATDGRPYAQHARETGNPRLAQWLALSATLPQAAPRARAARM